MRERLVTRLGWRKPHGLHFDSAWNAMLGWITDVPDEGDA
jgi:hypothetical protein